MKQKIESYTQILDRCLEAIAVICLTVGVSFAVYNVVTRNLFSTSSDLLDELCRYIIILGVFTYIGPLIKKGEHIRMDMIDLFLKNNKTKQFINLINSILLLAAFLYLFFISYNWVTSLYQVNITTTSGSLSMFIPAISLPIGAFFGCIYACQHAIVSAFNLFEKEQTQQITSTTDNQNGITIQAHDAKL
jgi:TRAP-type C4-dicarboxylate transport system permease small subunit